MGKKLIGITVAAIMLLGAFGLTACTQSLADCKIAGKAQIDAHAATKVQSDYSAEGWAAICKAVSDGKVAVDAATDKTGVDSAKTTAITGIDAVQRREIDLIERAKQSYVDTFLKAEYPEATTADLTFRNLGVYGESVVAVINDKYHLVFTEYVINLVIGGVDFSYSNGYPIRVWRDGNFYDLSEAYSGGLLTRENLEAIYNIYRNVG